MSTALYTGSFDPITKGHLDVIRTAAKMFSKVIVAVGTNPAKTPLFTLAERSTMIAHNIKGIDNVIVVEMPMGMLTADFAYLHRAVILKGVRMGSADFDYEWLMADINRAHVNKLRTIILPASPEFNSVSSSAAKELTKLHGNVHEFVPLNVKEALEKRVVRQERVVVTGSIGSGKSTIVQQICHDRTPGITHNIDLDVLAREVLFESELPAHVELREEFQRRWNLKEWTRKSVGDLIFAKDAARQELNDACKQPLLTRIRRELYGKEGLVIFNGALIIEAGWTYLANNKVVLLDVSPVDQMARLKKRNPTLGLRQLQRRVNCQYNTGLKLATIERQIKLDDYGKVVMIPTSGATIEFTTQETHNAFKKLFW